MITTDELEQTISAIANCKQDTTETSGQEMQSLVRDGLGALLNLHMQYIEQCKTASGASKRVAEQKTSYEKSLLALQNKRCVPSCRCAPVKVKVGQPLRVSQNETRHAGWRSSSMSV